MIYDRRSRTFTSQPVKLLTFFLKLGVGSEGTMQQHHGFPNKNPQLTQLVQPATGDNTGTNRSR